MGIGVPQYLCLETDQSLILIISLSSTFSVSLIYSLLVMFCLGSFFSLLSLSRVSSAKVPFCSFPAKIRIFCPVKGFVTDPNYILSSFSFLALSSSSLVDKFTLIQQSEWLRIFRSAVKTFISFETHILSANPNSYTYFSSNSSIQKVRQKPFLYPIHPACICFTRSIQFRSCNPSCSYFA